MLGARLRAARSIVRQPVMAPSRLGSSRLVARQMAITPKNSTMPAEAAGKFTKTLPLQVSAHRPADASVPIGARRRPFGALTLLVVALAGSVRDGRDGVSRGTVSSTVLQQVTRAER